jgi:general secretion pathway protein D
MYFLACILLLAGCTNKVKVDPDLELPRPNYKKVKRKSISDIMPKAWQKEVSVSISESIGIKDVIARISNEVGASVNLSQVDNINGITYSARKISFLQMLKGICRICKWRLDIANNGEITIKKDEPYMYTHEVAFLSNLRRMKLLTNIQTINKTDSQDVGIALESENTLNLWTEVEENLLFFLNKEKAKYSLNKQGGLILVCATQAEHEKIATFLDLLHQRVASQVLIEARIVEVTLNKQNKNGINWDMISIGKALYNNQQITAFESMAKGMTFLSHFGDARTLSNPRAVVLNNQHALFKVVKHNVYYRLETNGLVLIKDGPSNQKSKNRVGSTVISNANVIQTGIIFIIHPSIDFTNNSITLSIKPIISRADKIAEDPAISILGGKTKDAGMPVIMEKSIDTVVRVNDGETIILGGLTDIESNPGRAGFDSGNFIVESKSGEKRETVMVVKATVFDKVLHNREIQLKEMSIRDFN